MAQDRCDIKYAVAELSRIIAPPREIDRDAVKRLAQHLEKKPIVIQRVEVQEMQKKLEVLTDTDYAGCRDTRKSTSGGVLKAGMHTIKTWSSTQHCRSVVG